VLNIHLPRWGANPLNSDHGSAATRGRRLVVDDAIAPARDHDTVAIQHGHAPLSPRNEFHGNEGD
jgi:hypothetical protein